MTQIKQEWNAIPKFCQGYFEAMLASEDDLGNAGFYQLPREAFDKSISDCLKFQKMVATPLMMALAGSYDSAQAGMDFYLTRNGHGAGFWDRGLGVIGEELTTICKTHFKPVEPYLGDDGLIYL